MRLIYIAGPYTADNGWLVKENIHAAEKAAALLVSDGRAMPVTPHSIGASFYGTGTPAYWYAGTLELMRRCDAVLALPSWTTSRGATEEIRDADRNGQTVFYDVQELFAWLSGKATGTGHGQRGPLAELLSGLPQTLLLRCGNSTQEVRHWRSEADDGVLYEVSTINGVKLSPILRGAFPRSASVDVPVFEQVDTAQPLRIDRGHEKFPLDEKSNFDGGIRRAGLLAILDARDERETIVQQRDDAIGKNIGIPTVGSQGCPSCANGFRYENNCRLICEKCGNQWTVGADGEFKLLLKMATDSDLAELHAFYGRHSVAEHDLTPQVIDAAAPQAALDISTTGPVVVKAESLKPSAVPLGSAPFLGSFPFLVGAFGKSEAEAAAGCIIFALAQRGDRWRAIDWDEVCEVIKGTGETWASHPSLSSLMAPQKNPDGSEYRFVEWTGEGDFFHFTEAGIAAALRRNCKNCEHYAEASSGAGDCHQPRSGRFTVYASDSCAAFYRSTT